MIFEPPPNRLKFYVVNLLHSEIEFFHGGEGINKRFLDLPDFFTRPHNVHWSITCEISGQSEFFLDFLAPLKVLRCKRNNIVAYIVAMFFVSS